MSNKVWFITGAGRGFGREFAAAALGRGDRVVATARNPETLADLAAEHGNAFLPLALDVTDREGVFAGVAEAHERFGRLDVVVNNAGYGLFGAVEELTPAELRDQLETNLFGVLHVTQAVLPILRAQGSGHIIQISTVGGVMAFPNLGGYHASKWALEGLSESLAQEVAPFGIAVTLVEPGGYSTDWGGSSAHLAHPQPQYDDLRQMMASMAGGVVQGDPAGVGPAILKLVDAEQPPRRVFFGSGPVDMVAGVYQDRLNTWAQWRQLSEEAAGH